MRMGVKMNKRLHLSQYTWQSVRVKNTLQKTLYTLGIDEVGRGPLAGPVAVGVVRTSLTRKVYTKLLFGIRDSKKAKKTEREEWYTKALQ